jgi:hypothetical protein
MGDRLISDMRRHLTSAFDSSTLCRYRMYQDEYGRGVGNHFRDMAPFERPDRDDVSDETSHKM